MQSGNTDTKSLKTYIHPNRKVVNSRVDEALSLTKLPQPEEPKPKSANKAEDNGKTTQYIANLEYEIESLKAKLRDRENGMMYS